MNHNTLPSSEHQSIVDAEAEVFARKVESLILSHDKEVILEAADYIRGMQPMDMVNGAPVPLPLRQGILRHSAAAANR